MFIKVRKAGGFVGAGQWVAIARAANLPVICGDMIVSGFECAAHAHFIAADDWMGRLEHGPIGPLQINDVFDTVSTL